MLAGARFQHTQASQRKCLVSTQPASARAFKQDFHSSRVLRITAKKGTTGNEHFDYAINTFSWNNKKFILLGTAPGNSVSYQHVGKVSTRSAHAYTHTHMRAYRYTYTTRTPHTPHTHTTSAHAQDAQTVAYHSLTLLLPADVPKCCVSTPNANRKRPKP